MRKATEGTHCCTYIKWFDMQHPAYSDYLHHLANEGKRSPRTGAYLKAMGMRRGYPDYFLGIPAGYWHGMYIEMKKPDEKNKKLPAHQVTMLKKLARMGYYVYVAYSATDAIEITDLYLKHPLNVPVITFVDDKQVRNARE